jgi:2-polyprenyl-3-methyl-5-hydroxy-6-metoxy-1,4-benzoquinol methylase
MKKPLSSVYSRKYGLTFNLLKCSECGVFRTDPFPEKSLLSQIYSEDYAYELHEAVAREKASRARAILKLIYKKDPGLKLLEFGSGSGILLYQAQLLGYFSEGIEMSSRAGIALPKASKSKLFQTSAEEYLAGCKIIDASVILSHTFEHLMDPQVFLADLYNKMKPGMHLLIAVPNANNRFGSVRSRYWGYWQVPVHTYHFTSKSLTTWLSEAGFMVVSTKFRSGDFLSKGLFWKNFLGSKIEKNVTGLMIRSISLLSQIWFLFYKLGASDLIILVKKPN